MNTEAEKELLNKIRNDPGKFGELYDIYFDKIFNYVFRRITDFDMARDITSEVFIKVYLNLWKFQWRRISIGAWIYRIATNEVNQYFRKKKYRTQNLLDLGINSLLHIPDPASLESEKAKAKKELQSHTDFIKVQSILKSMDIKYQEVISLRYFDHKSIKEICEILGKKEGTIKSLISRGLKNIKKNFK